MDTELVTRIEGLLNDPSATRDELHAALTAYHSTQLIGHHQSAITRDETAQLERD